MTHMDLNKKRWFVFAASCLINLCIGSLYAWSVFATPLAQHLNAVTGSNITSLAIVFTIANAVGPITMIGGGALNRKLGTRNVILIGGTLFGLGMIATGFAQSLGALIVTYGLGVGLGLGMVYGCTISNTVKFFPDKSGLIGGGVTAAYGISSVIVPIVASALMSVVSVTSAFKILGAAMLVIIVGSAFFIEACPNDFCPAGYTPPAKQSGAASEGKDWRAMTKDPVFYVMICMLCCGAFSGMMIISQASPLAQRITDITPAVAATVVSVIALCNTGGRIIAGYLSDRLGVMRTIRLVFIGSLIGLAMLFVSGLGVHALFYAGVCIIALMFGSIMGVYPGFTAAQFGRRHSSVNYGIMFIGFALAGVFGPMIMSSLYASTGSDQTAFIVAFALELVGLALTTVYAKLNK